MDDQSGLAFHQEQPCFALQLGLTLTEVALLNRFCNELRQQHLQLEGAISRQQSSQLVQLLNRINNHIHSDVPDNHAEHPSE